MAILDVLDEEYLDTLNKYTLLLPDEVDKEKALRQKLVLLHTQRMGILQKELEREKLENERVNKERELELKERELNERKTQNERDQFLRDRELTIKSEEVNLKDRQIEIDKKLKIEELLLRSTELENRKEESDRDNLLRERELQLKEDQLREQRIDRVVNVATTAVTVGVPVTASWIWMKRGLKFEETGTFTSRTGNWIANSLKLFGKK